MQISCHSSLPMAQFLLLLASQYLKIAQVTTSQIIQNLKIFTKTIFSDLPSRLAVSYRSLSFLPALKTIGFQEKSSISIHPWEYTVYGRSDRRKPGRAVMTLPLLFALSPLFLFLQLAWREFFLM
jgi:hypothetical protein